jgi:methionine-rich copper-binding protein CopC
MRTRLPFTAVAGALLLSVLVLSPARVAARADLVSATPTAGVVLRTSPLQVDAFFSELIAERPEYYGLTVLDSAEQPWDNLDTVLDPDDHHHLSITLQAPLPPGTYTVYWWTLSAEDGESASGQYDFTIAGT